METYLKIWISNLVAEISVGYKYKLLESSLNNLHSGIQIWEEHVLWFPKGMEKLVKEAEIVGLDSSIWNLFEASVFVKNIFAYSSDSTYNAFPAQFMKSEPQII